MSEPLISDDELDAIDARARAALNGVTGICVGKNYPRGVKNEIVYFVIAEGADIKDVIDFLRIFGPKSMLALTAEVRRLQPQNERLRIALVEDSNEVSRLRARLADIRAKTERIVAAAKSRDFTSELGRAIYALAAALDSE